MSRGRVKIEGAGALAAAMADARKKAMRQELARRADGGPAPKVRESEDALHLRMAHHLHQLFPGGNPRLVQPARKAQAKTQWTPRVPAKPAVYEPAHPWAMWWHTPNQGLRTAVTGRQFVNMGMRKGFADIGLAFRLDVEGIAATQMPCPFVGQLAVIEAKAEDGRLSPEQARFRDDCERLGIWWTEARSVRDVDAFLRAQLAPWGHTLPNVRIHE